MFATPPRKRGYPFYFRVAERMAMLKVICFLMMFGLLDILKQSARNVVVERPIQFFL